MYWGGGGEAQFHAFLTAALLYMEVSGHLHVPAALPAEKDPSTHGIGGWMGPRASLDAVKRKILFRCRESSLCSLITIPAQMRVLVQKET
jgi:hypothetical protein